MATLSLNFTVHEMDFEQVVYLDDREISSVMGLLLDHFGIDRVVEFADSVPIAGRPGKEYCLKSGSHGLVTDSDGDCEACGFPV